jgi:hypothetical protein
VITRTPLASLYDLSGSAQGHNIPAPLSQSGPSTLPQEALAQFSEIVLPQAIGFWPPAWPLVIAVSVLVLLSTYGIYLSWKHRKNNQYRRSAIRELKQIQEEAKNNNIETIFCRTNELMKSCMIRSNYARHDFMSLSGVPWYNKLVSTLSEPRQKSFAEIEKQFLEWEKCSYSNEEVTASELQDFFSFCHIWIQHHRKARGGHGV